MVVFCVVSCGDCDVVCCLRFGVGGFDCYDLGYLGVAGYWL